ncbi:Oidioi.mRNA.OKI2018_I69.chr1.g3620.t1.cds [Oikopleura dioica]|uniref:Oidioi.mRNA.OKI2018_I69.chr1.g3620.t1.cds n=1 Tax=Oikopleura dioica TaxID=34765 RepID=A0ABN7SUN3_OIKDI|nr:Oidioi.mRNA.OKI2018_I69.chr1.g3620.t1.cds [Oikopleura dioica]
MGFAGTAELLTDATEKIIKYTTPFGYAWLIVLFIFRLLAVEAIGEPIYDGYTTENDAQDFKCITEQPGCRPICFNRFHPISHSRLWEMQILFISIPIFLFLGITLSVQEKNSKIKREIAEVELEIGKNRRYLSNDYYRKRKEELSGYVSVSQFNYITGDSEEVIWNPIVISCYYIFSVIKLGLEVFFIYNIYILQRITTNADLKIGFEMEEQAQLTFSEVWHIPRTWLCTVGQEPFSACSQDPIVKCFVPRAYEKTIFLHYCLAMQVISVVLIVCDLIYMIVKSRSLRNSPKINYQNEISMLKKPVAAYSDFEF